MCIRDSSKVAEAGAIIAGGHSISDPEPKMCIRDRVIHWPFVQKLLMKLYLKRIF